MDWAGIITAMESAAIEAVPERKATAESSVSEHENELSELQT